MGSEKSQFGRRTVLKSTAGAALGTALTVKSVSADADELTSRATPFVEATLTYDGDFGRTLGVSQDCGEPNYRIHDSELYVGSADVDQFTNRSPLILWNSGVTSEGELAGERTNTLLIEDDNGLKQRLHTAEPVGLPSVIIEGVDSRSATLHVDGREIDVRSDEERVVELEPQRVEVEVPGDSITEVENVEADGSDAATEVENTDGEVPDAVRLRDTTTETIRAAPSIRFAHHGKANVYGVEDGIVLPNDPEYPAARRAMRVGDIDSKAVGTGEDGANRIIIVSGGEN